jgi:hypothetical protein
VNFTLGLKSNSPRRVDQIASTSAGNVELKVEATGAWREEIPRFVDHEWSAVISEKPIIQVGSSM